MHPSYSKIVWSSLNILVENQYGEPLSGARVFLDCKGASTNPVIYCPVSSIENSNWSKGKKCYEGDTDSEGKLFMHCSGCEEGKGAKIVVNYNTAHENKIISHWNGYDERFDLGPGAAEGCYGRKPKNEGINITINTYCLKAHFFDGIFPLKNKPISIFSDLNNNIFVINESNNGYINNPYLDILPVKTNDNGEIILCKLTKGQKIYFSFGLFSEPFKNITMPGENIDYDIPVPPNSRLRVGCNIIGSNGKLIPKNRNMSLTIKGKNTSINLSAHASAYSNKYISAKLKGGYYDINFTCNGVKFNRKVTVLGDVELVFNVSESNITTGTSSDKVSTINKTNQNIIVDVCAYDRLNRPLKDVNIELTPLIPGYSEDIKRITDSSGCTKIFIPLSRNPIKYSLTAEYDNGLIGHKTFVADEDKQFNFISEWVACNDGTMNGYCSKNKPYKCVLGELKEDCIDCGCPAINEACDSVSWIVKRKCCPINQIWNGSECINRSDAFRIYLYPINYNISFYQGFANFNKFTHRFSDHLINESVGLSRSSFYVVNDSLFLKKSDYAKYVFGHKISQTSSIQGNLILWYIDDSFKEWYKKNIGYGKEPDKERYKVVGMDYGIWPGGDGPTGFTKLYSNSVYLNVIDASVYKAWHALAHEVGHTFGLCDQYHPELWSQQNARLYLSLHDGCKNDKPTSKNSDCDELKCPLSIIDSVCCFGVKINKDTYSTMGTAETEIKIDNKTMHINRKYTSKGREAVAKGIKKAYKDYI